MFFLVGIFPMDPFIWIKIHGHLEYPHLGRMHVDGFKEFLPPGKATEVVELWKEEDFLKKRGDFIPSVFTKFPKHKRSNPRSQLSQLA